MLYQRPELAPTVAIAAWAIAGFIAWVGLMQTTGFAFVSAVDGGRLSPQSRLQNAMGLISLGGMLAVPSFLVVLGVKQKLPGTARTQETGRGFPVDGAHVTPDDPKSSRPTHLVVHA